MINFPIRLRFSIFKSFHNASGRIADTVLVIFLCFFTETTFSQQMESKNDSIPTFLIDAIVITADRIPNKINNATSSVSVIQREEIDQLPVNSIADIMQIVPGFFISNRDGIGKDAIVSTRGFFGGGEAEYIQVLVNGNPMNDLATGLVNWNLVPINAISKLEISRGGSSSLFGDAALGGVINIFTSNKNSLHRIVSLQGGSYGSYDFNLRMQNTVDALPFQFYASHEQTNGFRSHGNGSGTSIGGDVIINASNTNILKISTTNQWISNCDPGPLTETESILNRESSSIYYKDDDRHDRRHQVNLEYIKTLSDNSDFSADIFYNFKKSNQVKTYTSPPVIINPVNGSLIGVYDTTLYGDTKERELLTHELGYNFQYNASKKSGHTSNKFSLGSDGLYGILSTQYYDQFHGFYNDYQLSSLSHRYIISDGEAKRKKYALYLNNELTLTEPLTITVGIRWDGIYNSYVGKFLDTTLETHCSILSSKIGLNYCYINTPKFKGNMYATINRSFKSPTLDQLFDQRSLNTGIFLPDGSGSYIFSTITSQPFSNALLKPQKSFNYEVGSYNRIKLLNDIYCETSVSLYMINVINEIDFDLQSMQYKNIQSSEHIGGELGVRLYWFPRLMSFLNYTRTDVTFGPGPYKGNYLKGIPRDVATLGINFNYLSGFNSSVTYNFVSHIYLNDENNLLLKDYGVVGVKTAYKVTPFTFFLTANNILDNKYNSTGYVFYGRTFFYPSAGFSYYGGINVEF